jgi:nitric oxide reductase NorD protein
MTGLRGLERSLPLFYRAICGRGCVVVPYDDDAHDRQHPDTATTVRLPSRVDSPTDRWYQVAMAHRAMHTELGTFALRLDGELPEPFFRRLRPLPDDGSQASHLEQFFGHLSRPALALEVFVALEDLRVDAAARRLLPGLRAAYDAARAQALATRPELAGRPPRSGVGEVLVRISLGAEAVTVAGSLVPVVARLAALAAPLGTPEATVESTAEATVRAFGLLARLPNVGEAEGPAREVDLVAVDSGLLEHEDDRLGSTEVRLEGDELFDVRLAPVRYRDTPGPRYLGQSASGMPMREAILRLTPAEPGSGGEAIQQQAQDAESGHVDVSDPSRPAPPPEPLPHDHGPDLGSHHHAAQGVLHAQHRGEFVYPEWDHRADRYLSHWCLVREQHPRPGRGDRLHRETLTRYRHLLPLLTAQLERVAPAGVRRLRRMPYGDDLDFDACLEAMVDLRTGAAPSEAVHAASVRDRRDVAVAFALDLSSSTAERLPVAAGEPARRILDLELEAVSLLMEALERVGDAYGIYGFSGTGREDVRVQVVKEIDEARGIRVLHRLDGLKPHHTTRMGPVVRHLTHRLKQHEAPTKLLVVLSDGRPFDLDYGQQYGEDRVLDYAVADTARSLDEARADGVNPYLLTVDPAGDDYLRRMCGTDWYRVIDDARDLPAALARLYVAARAGSGRAAATAAPGRSSRRTPGRSGAAAAARPA